MSAPEHEPAIEPVEAAGAAAAPVARAVAEDLESIFPQEGRPPRADAGRLKLGAARSAKAGRRWAGDRRAASLGALLAAGCIGVSAGALVARTSAPPKAAPPAVSPGVPITVATAALPAPGPLPAHPMTVPVAPPSAPPIEAANLASAPNAAPARLRRVSAAGPAAHRKATRTACARRAGCGRNALMSADARLRRAYASAERAGVSHAVLADYHDEWSRLRRRAPRQPALVTARYREMAADLSRLAAHERVAHAQPPPVGPFRRLRMQMAALWR
jgi:hypothetical protein